MDKQTLTVKKKDNPERFDGIVWSLWAGERELYTYYAGTFYDGSGAAPLDAPAWGKAGRVHDWRNYVPREIQESWHMFDDLTRLCFMWVADEAASQEEWD